MEITRPRGSGAFYRRNLTRPRRNDPELTLRYQYWGYPIYIAQHQAEGDLGELAMTLLHELGHELNLEDEGEYTAYSFAVDCMAPCYFTNSCLNPGGGGEG